MIAIGIWAVLPKHRASSAITAGVSIMKTPAQDVEQHIRQGKDSRKSVLARIWGANNGEYWLWLLKY
jgi:hypothetical protein